MRPFSLANVLALALPLSVVAHSIGGSGAHHHRDLALRATGDVQLQRRGFDRFTYYQVGLGACGQTNQPSDFIVALNSAQYGGGSPGPQCFKMISITCNGKTTTAQIMDECPGCPYGGLDMSEGLFEFFAPLSVGVLSGSWEFTGGSGGGGGGGGAPPPPPPATHAPPPPTTTWTPPSTTWTPTATLELKTELKATTSRTTHKTTSTTTSYTPTANDAGSADDVIEDLYQAMVGLGGMAVAN